MVHRESSCGMEGAGGDDALVPLTDVVEWVPGKRLSVAAIYRWATRGVKARNGKWVRLKAVRPGRRYYTTRAWYNAFLEELRTADVAHYEARQAQVDAVPPDVVTAERPAQLPMSAPATTAMSLSDLERELASEGL